MKITVARPPHITVAHGISMSSGASVLQSTLLWFACTEPERPVDSFTVWHYASEYGPCGGCRIKAEMQRHLHPGNTSVEWLIERLSVESP